MGEPRSQIVVGNKVWPTISRLAKKAGPRHAAIAFIGRDAPRRLTMKKGDVLVVNASRRALGAGATHPDALQEFVAKGVLVYSLDSLHSKVFVNGSHAIVGSANASASSERTEEAIVVMTTRAARRDVREYVDSLVSQSDLVDEGFLEVASQQFKEPKGGLPGVTGSDVATDLIRGPVSGLWILDWWQENEWSKSDAEFASREVEGRSTQPGFVVEGYNCNEERLRVRSGDIVIFRAGSGSNGPVWPPQVAVDGVVQNPSSKNWFLFSRVDLRLPRDVTEQAVSEALGHPGGELEGLIESRITDGAIIRRVLSLWGLSVPDV